MSVYYNLLDQTGATGGVEISMTLEPVRSVLRGAGEDDAGAVAALAYEAGKGHARLSVYDLMFPGPPGPTPERLGTIERLFLARERSFFHRSFYVVAEAGGRPVASLCTYSRRQTGTRKLISALRGIGWGVRDLEAMQRRMKPYLRVEPHVPRDSLIVENVGVSPELRGRGVGAALLDFALSKGREAGFTEAQLACFIGNQRARSLYERAGFEVTETLTDGEFEEMFDCPGMYRMVLRL